MLKRGVVKSEFLKLYSLVAVLIIEQVNDILSLCFILYIRMAISCRRRLSKVGSLALRSRSSYELFLSR